MSPSGCLLHSVGGVSAASRSGERGSIWPSSSRQCFLAKEQKGASRASRAPAPRVFFPLRGLSVREKLARDSWRQSQDSHLHADPRLTHDRPKNSGRTPDGPHQALLGQRESPGAQSGERIIQESARKPEVDLSSKLCSLRMIGQILREHFVEKGFVLSE
jgi:hypothetical protein